MKKFNLFTAVLVGLLASSTIALAANTFPTSLNNWTSGQVISSAWANALEAKIGVNGSTVRSTIDYLLKNGVFTSTSTIAVGTTATTTISSTATSTFQKGIDIAGGCFAISGVCLSGGGAVSGNISVTNSTTTVNDYVTGKQWVGSQLLVGTTSPNFPHAIIGSEAISIYDENGSKSDITAKVAGGSYSSISLMSSNGTLNTPTNSANNDTLGELNFYARILASNVNQAKIRAKYLTGGTELGFFTGPGSSGAVQRMTISPDGLVGLATTSSFAKLQITGTANTTFGTKATLALSDINAAAGQKHWTLSSQGGSLFIATSSDIYATSSVTALGINSNGKVTVSNINTTGCYAVNDKCFTGATTTGMVSLLPQAGMPAAGSITLNNSTTASFGRVVIPFTITPNRISIRSNTVTGAGVAVLSLYSEDGQTQYFEVNTPSIAAGGTVYTASLPAGVVLRPGIYYLAIVGTGAINVTVNATAQSSTSFDFAPTGEPKEEGTLVVSSGDLPATFTPSALTYTQAKTVISRIDD